MSEAPLPNSQEARTPDGTLKDAPPPTTTETTKETQPSIVTTETPTPQPTDKTVTDGDKPAPAPSILNKDAPAGAPEKYADFKLPDGFEVNAETMTAAQALFKESNLSQEQAQKFVDMWGEQVKSLIEAPTKVFEEMSTQWAADAMADPDIGPKLPQIKANIAAAFDAVGNPKLVGEFKTLMDVTGAGNHPAFIKVMAAWGKALGEGGHVTGRGPSPLGQKDPNKGPGSIAQALYPNLSSANR